MQTDKPTFRLVPSIDGYDGPVICPSCRKELFGRDALVVEYHEPRDSSASPDFYGTLSANRRGGLRAVKPSYDGRA